MPNKTLAIIHTSPVTVDVLKPLAAELLPGWRVVNFVDDSILPQLAENGGNLEAVTGRWLHYARFAEEVGANVILNACSSIGALSERARGVVGVPVVRIDDAMAEEAVRRGTRIGVAATLSTTLNPTMDLLRRKAEDAGREVTLVPAVAADAFRKLSEGDKEGHDAALSAVLLDLAAQTDVVALAQASMARVVATLPEAEQGRFLSSPRMGMERVRQVAGAQP